MKLIEIKPLQETEYNITNALLVIEQDDMLDSMFKDEIKISYSLLHTMITQNALPTEIAYKIKDYFDKLIITRRESLIMYLRLKKDAVNDAVKKSTNIVTTPINLATKKKNDAANEGVNEGVKSKKKGHDRYGLKKVLADIERQGGKPTTLQNAAISINRMKNIYYTLSQRYRDDMLYGTHFLNDIDCRDIIAVVDVLEKKLSKMLKRKTPIKRKKRSK